MVFFKSLDVLLRYALVRKLYQPKIAVYKVVDQVYIEELIMN